MSSVQPCPLPQHALLQKYKLSGAFADCYVTEVTALVSQADFVAAFYSTSLFKVERFILKWLAGRPSSDLDARRLAAGTTDAFAAWSVEARTDEQLLLADFTGRTRSWLMAVPAGAADGRPRTLLYFGSAVTARGNRGRDGQGMGFVFHALMGFHRLYSRLLLGAARSRVLRGSNLP